MQKFLYFFNWPTEASSQHLPHASDQLRIILLGVVRNSDKKILMNPFSYQFQDNDRMIFIAGSTFGNPLDILDNLTIRNKLDFEKSQELPKNTAALEYLSQSITQQISPRYVSRGQGSASPARVINLAAPSGQWSPPSGHVILAGLVEDDIFDIFIKLRSFEASQPILFFVQPPSFGLIPKEIFEQSNVYIVVGSYTCKQHIKQLNIQESSKFVLRVVQQPEAMRNLDVLSLYRYVNGKYPAVDFLISVSNQSVLHFFQQKPAQVRIDLNFWPIVYAGKVVNENVAFHALNSMIYYEKYLAQFLKYSLGFPCEESHQEEFSQGTFFTIRLDAQVAADLKYYGQLQFYLISQVHPLIAVGILKPRLKLQTDPSRTVDQSLQ